MFYNNCTSKMERDARKGAPAVILHIDIYVDLMEGGFYEQTISWSHLPEDIGRSSEVA